MAKRKSILWIVLLILWKQKRNSKCAGHPYVQTSIININKTLALLQTTGGKDVSSMVLCGNRKFSGLSILNASSVFSNVYLDYQKWPSYNHGMTLAAIYYECIDGIVQWMNEYSLTIICSATMYTKKKLEICWTPLCANKHN
jgi:hypothetical protein